MLKFLLIIILLLIFVGAISFVNLFRQLRDSARRMMGSDEEQRKRSQQRSRRTYGDQAGVFDRRSPEEANKKIFQKDEGEYVDYKEE